MNLESQLLRKARVNFFGIESQLLWFEIDRKEEKWKIENTMQNELKKHNKQHTKQSHNHKISLWALQNPYGLSKNRTKIKTKNK